MNMPSWIPDCTVDQMGKAFGTDNGQIGLSILRIKVPMNSASWYREVPTACRAKNMGAAILASPWSPPAHMKTSNSGTGGELRPEYYDDFAFHLSDFCEYMAAQGAALDVISIQNEPDIEVDYESCDWTPTQMRTFLKDHAAEIPAKVLVAESFNFNRAQTDPILNDPEAEAQVEIIGGHLYGGGLYRYPLAMSKGKEVWMTEHLDTNTDWPHALATGKEIHDCMVSDFNAYIWWYIRRYYGPIDDNGNVTKRGYVMSHFARFIRPGYVRVDADASPAPGVSVSAYKGSDTAVIVALNQNASARDVTFSFSGGTVARLNRYETTQSRNASYQGSVNAGDSLMVSLPANSITTFDGTLSRTYTNPVLPGDHPDLTLLKHGEDFYACGSSFHFTPYCPILHSRDLVHWEVIARAVQPDWSGLHSGAPGDGIWQGAITYFYDSFWLYFSNNAGGGQYFCKADSPSGPWSEPTRMRTTAATGASGYDNSIFVDDDTPYMLIKAGRYINRIQEIGPDGHFTGPVVHMDWVNADGRYSWAEGPVMCKRDGWYYYFIAGNVYGGQWVLRSRTLTGDPSDWEELGEFFAPITDSGTGFRGPNHITAPVQIQDGTWWALSHGYEKAGNDDWNGLGRQGLLHQVTWDTQGKPTGSAPTSSPVAAPKLASGSIPLKTTASDEFAETTLGLAWHFLNPTTATRCSLTENPGWMRLKPGPGGGCHLLQKEAEHSYHLVTKVSLDAASSSHEGGIYLTNGDESLFVKLFSGYRNGKQIIFSFDRTSYQVNNTVGNTVWLRLERSNHTLNGYYSADGSSWTQVGSGIQVTSLDRAQPNYNAWVGNSHGMYAQGKDVDFDFFRYEDGTQFDKIYITHTNLHPQGMGGEVENCLD